MNGFAPVPIIIASNVPALIRAAGERAQTRFWEFFVSNIRNPHTRRAYGRSIAEFLAWCAQHELASIIDVEPLHVGTYIEAVTRSHSAWLRHSGKIVREFNHPAFSKLSLHGRPKQVDFALLTRDTDHVECVIEAKWVRDTPYSRQAILNDLLRLECFRKPPRHVRRYFLVGGLRENVQRNFLNQRYQNAGTTRRFLTELLDPKPRSATKTVDVLNARAGLRKFYLNFEKDYRTEIPKKFKTTLLSCRIDQVAVYLWQIESVQNRSEFSAAESNW